MTPKKIAIIVGIIVVLVGAVFWTIRGGPLWNRSSNEDNPTPPVSKVATSSEEAKVVVSPGVNLDYGYATKASSTPQKGSKPSPNAPSLNRPIVIPVSFSPADASLATASINKLIGAIKKSPANGALWADLGMERKGIEDYIGAKEAYAYALKLMPDNAVVAENLGVIYGDYLKDYSKAEQYFRLSITLEPLVGYRYLRLFELYRYGLKDTGKAKAILEEGLRKIPRDPSLKALLETMD